MKKILTISLALLALNLNAQMGKNYIDQNYIEVTGRAEMEVSPDQIYLKIFITEKDNKGKQSLEDLELEMMKALEHIGFDLKKDLAIIDMTSNFKDYWLKKKDIFTSREYQLLCKDAGTAGQVFIDLEKLGISNISIKRIDHSQIREFRSQVKVEAIKAAKTKAELLTGAIDQKVGKAIHIQEQDRRPYQVNAVSNVMIRGSSTGQQEYQKPEIEFQKIKLEYSIFVRFEIL